MMYNINMLRQRYYFIKVTVGKVVICQLTQKS
nr:MAG TPA: hypothetical protein [Caudoviricetes sp.]